jgi:hypothetical protein
VLSLRNASALNNNSLNECISNTGHGFYTWQIGIRHRQWKWCQHLHRGELSRRKFLNGGYNDLIYYVTLSYIYVNTYLFLTRKLANTSICGNFSARTISLYYYIVI